MRVLTLVAIGCATAGELHGIAQQTLADKAGQVVWEVLCDFNGASALQRLRAVHGEETDIDGRTSKDVRSTGEVKEVRV